MTAKQIENLFYKAYRKTFDEVVSSFEEPERYKKSKEHGSLFVFDELDGQYIRPEYKFGNDKWPRKGEDSKIMKAFKKNLEGFEIKEKYTVNRVFLDKELIAQVEVKLAKV